MTADHIYIHVPFCSGKCAYCAFYSELGDDQAQEEFVTALDCEMELRLGVARVGAKTLYIGGGTPSVLSDASFEALFEAIGAYVACEGLREWTIEINPGTLTDRKLAVMKEYGVNRVSMGVQSMSDEILTAVGRRHTVKDVVDTVTQLERAGFGVPGCDLIAGLPGVFDDMWRSTLEQVIGFAPGHVSVYGLSIEPQSRWGRTPLAGRHEDSAATIDGALRDAARMLGTAGYEQYETSNFARPGCQCEHNLSCWRGHDYLGLGPAASSRLGQLRGTNAPDLRAYTAALRQGVLPPREEEELDVSTDVTERLMFGFRLYDGVDMADFCTRYGEAASMLRGQWEAELLILSRNGLVRREGSTWRLTERGHAYADHVAERMIVV